MKGKLLLITFILFMPLVLSYSFNGDYNNALTYSIADKRYCSQGGTCNLTSITVTNQSTILLNITNLTGVNVICDSIGNCYTLSQLNSSTVAPDLSHYLQNGTTNSVVFGDLNITNRIDVYDLTASHAIVADIFNGRCFGQDEFTGFCYNAGTGQIDYTVPINEDYIYSFWNYGYSFRNRDTSQVIYENIGAGDYSDFFYFKSEIDNTLTNYPLKTEVTNNITSSNTSMKTYVDTTISKEVIDRNNNITSANTSIKTYVDNQGFSKYNFTSNNFNGSGSFNTVGGQINATYTNKLYQTGSAINLKWIDNANATAFNFPVSSPFSMIALISGNEDQNFVGKYSTGVYVNITDYSNITHPNSYHSTNGVSSHVQFNGKNSAGTVFQFSAGIFGSEGDMNNTVAQAEHIAVNGYTSGTGTSNYGGKFASGGANVNYGISASGSNYSILGSGTLWNTGNLLIQAGNITQSLPASTLNPIGLGVYLYGNNSLQLLNNATVWDDMIFTLSSSGGVPLSYTSLNNTPIQVLSFSGTVANDISGCSEIPHSWKLGSLISPHIHIEPTTAAGGSTAVFNLTFLTDNLDGTLSKTGKSGRIVNMSNLAWNETTVEFNDINMTGYKLGTQVCFYLQRNPIDVNDTYTGAIAIKQLSAHYEQDSLGSREEWDK